jgi:hypothetical protein
MSSNLEDKQKSLKRRFLLILGVVTFICVLTVGLMLMFWDKLYLSLGLSTTQRFLYGGFFVAYGILRFSRIFKIRPDEEV